MKFYKYWVREKQPANDASGKSYYLHILGRSNESIERARQAARERLADILQRLRRGESLRGGYSYGERMQCEQLIDEINGADGETLFAITRNRYNSLVLNTRDIVFADVDIAEPTLGQRLKKLFGLGQTPRERQIQKIRAYHDSHPGSVLRIYATRAGLRVLLLSLRAVPGDPAVQQFFEAVDCDPVYIKLCRAQQSFRARLTPKHWRCGVSASLSRYPWADAVDEQRFTDWLEKYERASQKWSVCQHLETLGTPRIDRELEKVIELHDRYTIRFGVTQLA